MNKETQVQVIKVIGNKVMRAYFPEGTRHLIPEMLSRLEGRVEIEDRVYYWRGSNLVKSLYSNTVKIGADKAYRRTRTTVSMQAGKGMVAQMTGWQFHY